MKFTAPRGTFDILPENAPVWQSIEKTAREVFEAYNYKEIRTPIFESTDLFARSIGSTTDIVTKEMYTFLDKKGRSLTLRPEETAPVVRACLENNLLGPDKVVKLYYIGPMFRYERPQAGRFRQFHQVGVEAFGSSDPLLDVEVITLAVSFFEKLGLEKLKVDINSVGCKECRPAFQEELKKYFRTNIKDMCEECQKRLEFNPLRILDCKNEMCQRYILKAPAPLNFICGKCKASFEKIIGYLKETKVNFEINNRLVRGLDYYTNVTFEVISERLGAQNAVCGGGRYDNLVEELGGRSTPAVGFAVGIERVIEILKSFNVSAPSKKLQVFIASIGEQAGTTALKILRDLRNAGISADMDFVDRSLKAKLKAADKSGAKYAVIIGEEEISKDSVIIKKMSDGSQKSVLINALLSSIESGV
jgi:histidyl-tRNA synthetase